jgi:dTDP-4-amino-4,6-dideoxygalactose transaminase
MRRNHGQAKRYIHEMSGFNYRMEGIQGAVLGVKLHYLNAWNSRRVEHAHAYDRLLANCHGLRLTTIRPDRQSVYHLYVVRTEHRDALRDYLLDRGIETGLHYPMPIHLQPAYAYLGYKEGDFPVAEATCASLVSLPMYAELSPAQVEHVAEAIQDFLS